jgi:hypothetical protein
MAMADDGRRVKVAFHSWDGAPWSFEQTAEGPDREHPVTQFRRLAAEVTHRVDQSLVAIHGEPKEPSQPLFRVSVQRADYVPIPNELRARFAVTKLAASNLPDGWSIEIAPRRWRLFGRVEASAVLTLPLAQRLHDGVFLTRGQARRKLTAWIWDEATADHGTSTDDPGDPS